MGKSMTQEPNASKGKDSLKRNTRMTVGASLSVAMLVAPLSLSSVMAAENDNPDGSVDIDVSTSWLGDVGEEAHLNVLANGEEVDEITLTPETGWDYTFENLPLVSEDDGEPFVYTVTEDNAEGYDTLINGDQETGFIVSNIQANNTALADDGVLDGSVAVTYKNQDGDTIAFMDVTRGKTGEKYNIVPKDIPGHTLIETEGETAGTFAAGVTTWIEFTYQLDPEYTPEDPEDGYIEGVIEARYVNQDGDEIALREKSTGEVGSTYELNSKSIQGYTFDKVEGVEDGTELLFEEGSQVVTYVYTENEKDEKPVIGMVVTKHVNEQGEEIADRERVSGEIDAAYKTAAKEIAGYEFVEVKGEVSGTFAQGIAIVEYVYKETVDDVTPEPEPEPTDAPDVNLGELYDSIELGISYDEAVAILGFEGTTNGKVTSGVVMHVWKAANGDSLGLGFNQYDELVTMTFVAANGAPNDEEPSEDEKPVDETPKDEEEPVIDPPKDDETPVVEEPKDENKEEPVVKESKFIAMYKALDFGISYEEAVMIVGTEGTIDADNQGMINGKAVAGVAVYTWTTDNGDVLTLAFLNDKLASKALEADGSTWLEYDYETGSDTIKDGDVTPTPVVADGKDVKASNFKKFYDALEYGMTYKEAVAILGSEGEEWEIAGKNFMGYDVPEGTTMYSWKADNGDVLVLGFYRDKLIVKSATIDGVEHHGEATEDEVVAMFLADNKLSDEDKEKVRAEVLEGKKLADTATNTFNLIAIGAGLLLAAGAGLFAVNRRRQVTDAE